MIRPLRALSVGIAMLLGASVPGQAAEPSPHHTLWSMKGKTNTVYLLGSVHFLRSSEKLPPAMDAAYADAEKLIMEIDMDDLDPMESQRIALELGMLPPEESLEQSLGKEAYARFVAESHRLGVDPAMLNRLRPWLAALTLVQLNLAKMGLDPDAGVERRLLAQATRDRKEIVGLETLRQQLGFLASMPAQHQREFLLYSIEDTARATREIDDLIAAWRRGDTTALANLLAEGFDRYPEIYGPLTVDRNRQWIPKLEALLDDTDDYLVVVGALHLVGKESVIDLLQRQGHKVRQH